mmetsp:Transcript_28474/g.43056  ORF Transcript_28474/g.43056 Transcript_28474/m.43056 type:complete len:90 (-) Transcript_28474:13-282(-)
MNSCHKETLEAALGRLGELGVCQVQTYESHMGQKQIYLRCPIENAATVDKYLEVLSSMSSVALSQQNELRMEEAIKEALKLALGPMARL